jgi:acyl-homoserine lactone acylase PvdQ
MQLDRFFQMDMTRRVLSGRPPRPWGRRTSAATGCPPLEGTTLDVDRLFRVLDLRRAAAASATATADSGPLVRTSPG